MNKVHKFRLSELLSNFSVRELEEALSKAKLPEAGTKSERIERLCALQKPPDEVLDLFSAEALRIVCNELDVPQGDKGEMIRGLVSWLMGPRRV